MIIKSSFVSTFYDFTTQTTVRGYIEEMFTATKTAAKIVPLYYMISRLQLHDQTLYVNPTIYFTHISYINLIGSFRSLTVTIFSKCCRSSVTRLLLGDLTVKSVVKICLAKPLRNKAARRNTTCNSAVYNSR